MAQANSLELEAKAEINRTKLTWVSNLGEQADVYAVQKWDDAAGEFKHLSLVNNAHKGGQLASFTAYDNQPEEGDNVYRVVTTLRDGTELPSETRIVRFSKGGDFGVFPNPAQDYVDLDLSRYQGQDVTLYVYNGLGNVVLTRKVSGVTTQPVHLPLDNWASGQFTLRIVAPGKRDAVKKFIVQN